MTRRELLNGFLAGAGGGAAAVAAISRFVSPEGVFAQATQKAKPLNLKITGFKTFIVAPRDVYVKVYTNQGLVGLGQALATSKESTLAAAIMENERLLVGWDPTQIEKIWQAMYLIPRWRGGPILNAAISAIDIALWDILGQALGQPIYMLLGGKARDRIRCYGGGGGTTPESWEKTKADGYTCSRVGVRGGSVTEMIEHVKALRKAAGPLHDIAIHMSGTFTTPQALSFMKGVEECNLYFVEEPLPIEDVEEWALLRAHTSTPIAGSELMTSKYQFAPLIARHLVDYVQPDVCSCGGILEMKKIAIAAETYRIQTAPHNPHGPVGAFATFHVDATTPNFGVQETRAPYDSQYNLDLHDGLVPMVKNGYAELPTRPGLGTTLNETVAAKYPYKPTTRSSGKDSPDGSIGTGGGGMEGPPRGRAEGRGARVPARGEARGGI